MVFEVDEMITVHPFFLHKIRMLKEIAASGDSQL